MSVYRPKNGKGEFTSPFYHFDFRIGGKRFSGSTGCRTKPEARKFEGEARVRAKASIAAEREGGSPALTIDLAAARFWSEVGQFYKGNARKTFKASLAWLVRTIGPDRPISAIRNPTVADLVARRRGDGVTNATVNRTVTEPLRCVLRRADIAWDCETAKINWKAHRLPVPKERIRELGPVEEEVLLRALPEDYAPLVRFALISGFRLAECVGLRWRHIDWGNATITVIGKGNKEAMIPLSDALRRLLFPLQGHHADRVFTYVARRARPSDGRERGARYPITYEGMKTAWARAIASSGVQNFRFHDNRHTAATRLLRSGANLKEVQFLLRHEDITTTSKYAHVTMEDIRAAMARAEVTSHASGNSRVSDSSRKTG